MTPIKTSRTFIKVPLCSIEHYACENLIIQIIVFKGIHRYCCDRSSQSYCDGKGWCPLRYHSMEYTPKMRSNGSGWRHY
jgi:hypothetical protein